MRTHRRSPHAPTGPETDPAGTDQSHRWHETGRVAADSALRPDLVWSPRAPSQQERTDPAKIGHAQPTPGHKLATNWLEDPSASHASAVRMTTSVSARIDRR